MNEDDTFLSLIYPMNGTEFELFKALPDEVLAMLVPADVDPCWRLNALFIEWWHSPKREKVHERVIRALKRHHGLLDKGPK